MRLLGIIAIIWTLDCFVGFYLTLPRPAKRANAARAASVTRQLDRGFWARWKPAWAIKTSGSALPHQFRHSPRLRPLDMARAVRRRLHGLFPQPLFRGVLAADEEGVELYADALRVAHAGAAGPTGHAQTVVRRHHRGGKADGHSRGWSEPVGAVYYAQLYDIYSVSFFRPGDDHGAGGVGPAQLYYDGARRPAARCARSLARDGGGMCSCRPSSRCIRAASSGFPAES